MIDLEALFRLDDQVAVITGGSGTLGALMAEALGAAGARVIVLSRRLETLQPVVERLLAAGYQAQAIACDVQDQAGLEAAASEIAATYGQIDILVNSAGGNRPQATTSTDLSFFDLDQATLRQVIDLNLMGTLMPCQVFGRAMAERKQGCIINIASMAGLRPLTRVAGYSAAKAAVVNLTQWLAVHLAQEYGSGLRVNGIAPGFFVGEQNRALLLNDDGSPTPRGQTIIAHTPAARFGEPQDLASTLVWLCGPGARFVNGVVVSVDGGFAAFGGV